MTRIITVFLLIFSLNSNAALIDKGEYVSDTITGKDWLKLNILNGYSYDSVSSGVHGYTSNGWKFATMDDLLSLVANYVSPTHGTYPDFPWFSYAAGNFEGANYLIPLLGMNVAFNDSRASYNITGEVYEDLHQITLQGYFDSGLVESPIGLAEITAIISVAPGATIIDASTVQTGRWLIMDNFFYHTPMQVGPHISSFLVRTTLVVPEPPSNALILFGLITSLIARYRIANMKKVHS